MDIFSKEIPIHEFYQSLDERKIKELLYPTKYDGLISPIFGIFSIILLILPLASTTVVALFLLNYLYKAVPSFPRYLIHYRTVDGVIFFIIFIIFSSIFRKINLHMKEFHQQFHKNKQLKLNIFQKYQYRNWIYRQISLTLQLLDYLSKDKPIVIPILKKENKFISIYSNLPTYLRHSLEELDKKQQENALGKTIDHEIIAYEILDNDLEIKLLTRYKQDDAIQSLSTTLTIDIYPYIQAKKLEPKHSLE